MKPVQILFDAQTLRQLKQLALDTDTNVSELVRGSVKAMLNKQVGV
jgi:hypothetical protein